MDALSSIIGIAAPGKSRLLREFCHWLILGHVDAAHPADAAITRYLDHVLQWPPTKSTTWRRNLLNKKCAKRLKISEGAGDL